MVKKISVIL